MTRSENDGLARVSFKSPRALNLQACASLSDQSSALTLTESHPLH